MHDWELYKLRMLNASHSCMAYLAALDGIVYVDEAIAVPALSHRLSLRPELWVQKVRAEDVVRDCLESVPAPSAEDSTARRR